MDALIERILRVAARAPSAHNAQPWRIVQIDGGIDVGLHDDRLLKEGDPTGRDALLGLGCWIEAAAIAAGEEGTGLDVAYDEAGLAAFSADPGTAPADPLVRVRIARAPRVPGGAAATSADVLGRAVHRGELRPIAGDAGMGDALREPWLRIARVPGARAPRLVALGDAGSIGRRAVAREAIDWLRFTRRDPRFERDGLTAPTMLMPGWAAAIGEALKGSRGGRAALEAGLAAGSRLAPLAARRRRSHPGLFVLVADGRERGAAGIAGAPDRPTGLDARDVIAAGRALMRAWLAAHRGGIAVAPASQVIDAPRALAALRRRLGLRPAEVALAVFAAGEPVGPTPRSPRLPS